MRGPGRCGAVVDCVVSVKTNNVRKHHCQEGRRVPNEILRLLLNRIHQHSLNDGHLTMTMTMTHSVKDLQHEQTETCPYGHE